MNFHIDCKVNGEWLRIASFYAAIHAMQFYGNLEDGPVKVWTVLFEEKDGKQIIIRQKNMPH